MLPTTSFLNISRRKRLWPLFLVFGVLIITLVLVGIREVFLGYDSMGNYVHVWYISKALFTTHRIPLKMEVIDGGNGLAFPYGVVPWTIGAVFFNILGTRAVTLLMVAAVVVLLLAANLARLRFDPWLTAIFVSSPVFLEEGILSFQLPLFWAAAFFFLFVFLFEKRWYKLAFFCMLATVYTHPFLGSTALAGYLLLAFRLHPDRRPAILSMTILGVGASLPMVWYLHGAPLARWRSPFYLLARYLERLGRGEPLILLPFVLVYFRAFFRKYAAAIVGAMLILNVGLLFVTHSYFGLLNDSRPMYDTYLNSGTFQPGAVYRIISPDVKKDAMLRFAQSGAVLANDFFSESMFRNDWAPEEYAGFLKEHAIDYVVIDRSGPSQRWTNEDILVLALTREGEAAVAFEDPGAQFVVYDVRLLRGPPDGSGF